MSKSKKEQQKLPMLLFFLQHKKSHQLIKSLFNEKLAFSLLQQYGIQTKQYSKKELFIMNQNIEHFTIQDLIEIKGSNYQKVKTFQNLFLQQTLLRKLKTNYTLENKQRNLLWLQFTQIYSSHNLYQNLAELELPPDTQCMIQKDVKRTYYNKQCADTLQKDKATVNLRQSIKQSLGRFALYNPYLLYCQGMNQIFGFLHEQGFRPKQSFFIFKRISQILLPADYYSSLEGIVSYLKILWQMLTVLYPDVHKKLNWLIKSMDISGSYLCVFSNALQWFVCLFTNSMLNRQVRRIFMDYFLLEGIPVLFKTALAIFQYLKQTILKVSSFESYIRKVEQQIRKYNDVQNLKRILSTKYISRQILFLLKQYASIPRQQSERNLMQITKKCSRKWNFCLQKLQNNMQQHFKYEFFVFKRKQSVKIIPDYLSKLNNYFFDKKKNVKPVDMTKIGRISHICSPSSQTCTQDSLSQTNTKKQSPFMSRYTPSPNKNYIIDIKQPVRQQQNKIQLETKYPVLNEFITNENIKNSATYQSNCNNISQSFVAVNNDNQYYHRKQTLQYRQIIKQKLRQQTQKKTMQKSQSMMFMKRMVDNQSYSNLLSLLQNQQMDKMFDIGSQSDQESQTSSFGPTYGKKPFK